jgi:hypothetical protein
VDDANKRATLLLSVQKTTGREPRAFTPISA